MDDDGAPIKMQHFESEIIRSICVRHSVLEVLYQIKCRSCCSAVSMHCVVGIENVLNHCRSMFVRKTLWLIQDHLSHTKKSMIMQLFMTSSVTSTGPVFGLTGELAHCV